MARDSLTSALFAFFNPPPSYSSLGDICLLELPLSSALLPQHPAYHPKNSVLKNNKERKKNKQKSGCTKKKM